MNLNYEKIRARVEHGGNQWTSYSDLFLVLSVVFLLLYVFANLRSNTYAVITQRQVSQAKAELEEMKKQIKNYETVRDDYLSKGASQDEIAQYQDLMSQMSLLEKEAKEKHDELTKEAQIEFEKEQGLNRYQMMVKNIITANMVAQQKLKKRDQVIEDKQQVIAQRDQQMTQLEDTVQDKENEIAQNNQQISGIQDKLQDQIKQVEYAFRAKKRSKEKMEKEVARLQAESDAKISTLRSTNQQYVSQLQSAQAQVEAKSKEAQSLMSTLAAKEKRYKSTVAEMERNHEAEIEQEHKDFEAGLAKAQLSAEQRVAEEKSHAAAVERKNAEYQGKLAAVNGELGTTRSAMAGLEGKYKGKLAALSGELDSAKGALNSTKGALDSTKQAMEGLKGKYQGEVESLAKSNEGLKKDLAVSLAKQNEQKVLARRIKSNFTKAGIDADIDPKTGDVTINFGNEYFDRASSTLKGGMKVILERVMPVYAKSLFEDVKIAQRITSVEIVGFASPTYQGHYVNPDSLDGGDRQAVNYNMDLSYQRAKSIFKYVFDANKMRFEHQKQLLTLAKVSGRSYLATEKIGDRAIASTTGVDKYCSTYDCNKSQRVIIKFNLREE